MSPPRSSLSPTTALAIGVLVTALAALLGQTGYALLSDGASLSDFADASLTLAVLRHAAGGAILLVGIFAALRLDRYERPLVVVAPAVFLVSLAFAFVVNLGLAANGGFDSLAGPVTAYLGTALFGALSQTATVIAVTLVVRAAEGTDSGGLDSLSQL